MNNKTNNYKYNLLNLHPGISTYIGRDTDIIVIQEEGFKVLASSRSII